jgi:uncharacterized protein (TIGR03000 family)
MNRKLWCGLVICVALVGMTLIGGVQQADAGCGLFGGWYGGWYGGYGGGFYAPVVYRTSWYGYGCGWRSHRWAGCGWRSWYGSSCCDPCCSPCYVSCCYDPCDTCGYSVDSCGCGGETWDSGTYQEVPTEAQPAPANAPTPAEPQAKTDGQSAFINVHVPAGAKVYVNGQRTTSAGQFRQYVSHGLKRGSQYRYVLRAEVVRNGQTVTRTQMVAVTAGQRRNVAFHFNATQDALAQQPVETNLKVRVPKDSKVYLSGNETRSTGSVREFTTTQLATGQTWQQYEIRVESEQHGQPVVQTKVVTLTGGQTQEVAFDFDAPQIASR